MIDCECGRRFRVDYRDPMRTYGNHRRSKAHRALTLAWSLLQ